MIELGRIIRKTHDGSIQILLYGEHEKLWFIWHDLMDLFPYDYSKTKDGKRFHNISLQQGWPIGSGKYTGGFT